MTRRLLASAVAVVALLGLGPELLADVVCVGGGCGGGGTVTSPVATDPLSLTGAVTFDNAANTPLVCSDGLQDSTLTAGRVTFAGASGRLSDDADLTFATDTLTATKVSVSSTAAGALSIPSTTAAVLRLGDSTNPYLSSYYSGTTGGIQFGRNAVAAPSYLYASNTVTTLSAAGNLLFTPGAGAPGVTTQALTASTMTSGGSAGQPAAQLRTVTSYYEWTNAMVAALAGTAGDINVATLPAGTQVLDALIVITGAAAGPATVTVSCGDAIGGTPFTNLVAVSDAKAAANTVYGDAVAERGSAIDTEFWYLPSYTGTTLVTCHFISTGADLSTVTGSTGRVWLTTRKILP